MNKLLTTPVWPSTVTDAIAIQQALVGKLCLEDKHGELKTVAGIDCSYDVAQNMTFAVVVLMRVGDLKPIKQAYAKIPTTFPYVPGLLSFREIPAILEALKNLPENPDVLMVDGQGIAHPRRLGIAAHLGVLLDMPAIGVAKSLLTGHYVEPGPNKGDSSPLLDKANNKIGTVLRSKGNVNTLFVSPGHRVSHDTAVDLTLRCLTKYRLPEPTRIADKISKDKNSDAFLGSTNLLSKGA